MSARDVCFAATLAGVCALASRLAPAGVPQLWIPALVMALGSCLSIWRTGARASLGLFDAPLCVAALAVALELAVGCFDPSGEVSSQRGLVSWSGALAGLHSRARVLRALGRVARRDCLRLVLRELAGVAASIAVVGWLATSPVLPGALAVWGFFLVQSLGGADALAAGRYAITSYAIPPAGGRVGPSSEGDRFERATAALRGMLSES